MGGEANGGRSGGGGAGEDPGESLVEIPEDFDAGVAGGFAEKLEHAGEAKGCVAGDEDRAARSGGKNGGVGEAANVFGVDLDFGLIKVQA